ncbi:bile acid:sodium symporter family protein [Psychrobacillus lasiicapitis]|uniref:Bile acid:sodium symporter family protein n=1 Tax=Psychrobacillus lasiicapitis TaxID=1636719 RepID=A0A544T395_9BACI|nr:bile acid:sodium symporter family protein [Psychrobacillus lasiicapitis]TQR11923.1 bile acid:sodium symporter family protein [Psychrobacillus lasiicapitis]GGA18821.1 sodium transporter [Psychrobacillus lasiicapitis]
MKFIRIATHIISKYMPAWIVVLSFIAYFLPNLFIPIRNLTGLGLGTIFLLMGLSLSTEKLLLVIKNPKHALIGVLLKWSIMVAISICVAYLFFGNNAELATGIILAGTVPSGTSANVYTFIAGGEAALSITMATMDTVISPILTPTLVQFFAGKLIPIAFWPLFLNIIYIVFIPLFLGLYIQWKFGEKIEKVKPYTPVLSQLALFIVVLSVVSSAQSSLQANLSILPLIFVAVFFQVSIPMCAGYLLAKWWKVPEQNARAILFHTGICNTALAATLAMEHVSSLAAVPAVANMVVNLTIGAIVANFFANKKEI